MVAYEYDAWGNVTVSGTLAESIGSINPIRYRGYYYDEESGFYYLMSRYYDAVTGRFLNADEPLMLGARGTILGYNLFAYCENNPVIYRDKSGYALETILDVGSILWSLVDLITEPSWLNLGYLLWDIGAALVPFVPGSYIAKGGKFIVKVASKIDDFADGSKFLTGTYKKLKKVFKGIKGVEIHHLVEKRFKNLFKSVKSTDNYLSIPLGKDLHKIITNRWRNLHKVNKNKFKNFAYGSNYSKITKSQMRAAIKEVYKDMPQLLDETLEWFEKNWSK